MEKIVQDFPQYKGKGGLTQRVMKRLVVGARCAIKMHSLTKDIEMLRKDLRNGPSHIFNDHRNCSATFCKVMAETVHSNQVQLEQSSSDDNPFTSAFESLIQDEIVTHNDEDEARGADNTVNHKNISDSLFFKIQRAGDRLVSMAPQLITNATSDVAECFMNIRCKFDGGKFYNRIQRGNKKKISRRIQRKAEKSKVREAGAGGGQCPLPLKYSTLGLDVRV